MKIKPELVEEYKAYLHTNVDSLFDKEDPNMPFTYIMGIFLATEYIGESLDQGETVEVAMDSISDLGLTGYMAGAAVAALVKFNPRGEEFKVFWNKIWGLADAEGPVNPAIMTVRNIKRRTK